MSPNNIEKNKSPLDSGSEGIVQLQQRIQSLKKEIEDFKKQTLDTDSKSKDQENILTLLQDIEKRVNQFDQLDKDKKRSEIKSLEQALEILTSTKSALSTLKTNKSQEIKETLIWINKTFPWSSEKANSQRLNAYFHLFNYNRTKDTGSPIANIAGKMIAYLLK